MTSFEPPRSRPFDHPLSPPPLLPRRPRGEPKETPDPVKTAVASSCRLTACSSLVRGTKTSLSLAHSCLAAPLAASAYTARFPSPSSLHPIMLLSGCPAFRLLVYQCFSVGSQIDRWISGPRDRRASKEPTSSLSFAICHSGPPRTVARQSATDDGASTRRPSQRAPAVRLLQSTFRSYLRSSSDPQPLLLSDLA